MVVEEDIQVNYSKNTADLTLGNMHLVIALLTNGIITYLVLTLTDITDINRFHTLASFRHSIYLIILTLNSGCTCEHVKDDW